MKVLVTIVAAALLVAACGSDSAGTDTYVTGTVTAPPDAPPNSELPPTAVLNVTLQDVSRADAPATVLSTQTIELTEFPIAFELPYDLGDIVDNHTYTVAARVQAGGDLLMISDTATPVITRGAPTSDVTVALVYIAAN
ncbi:MAG TPA: YbaY family lipoprotein [Ilumatobacteraceae bacterium]|nr:YbaY family lipoprotein [Ilumatobacteraceae bacterium]